MRGVTMPLVYGTVGRQGKSVSTPSTSHKKNAFAFMRNTTGRMVVIRPYFLQDRLPAWLDKIVSVICLGYYPKSTESASEEAINGGLTQIVLMDGVLCYGC